MRCYYCDWCPTAPSLSTTNDARSVKLIWDEKLKGWHCGNQCGLVKDREDEDDLREVLDGRINTGQAPLSEP